MSKEIILGIIPAVLLFLVFLGFNIMPLLLVGLFVSVILFMLLRQNGFSFKKTSTAKVVTDTQATFEHVGGQQSAKKEIKEALDFLLYKEDIDAYGIRPLKGLLLTGPPGTGKTLLAKAAANYTDSAFISSSGSEFVEMYVGVGAQRIRDLFKKVRQTAEKNNQDSGILFIDEIDILAGKRDGQQHREYDQTLNQLLTEMDGMDTASGVRVLVMAATNRADMLDPALLRPGRFDRHISVDLPDKNARTHILNIHTQNKPIAEDVDLDKIGQETFNFSGAQLESLVNEAAIYALREQSDAVAEHHFSAAIDKVLMGEASDRSTNEEEKKRVAIHELGHGIVSEIVRPESVSQVALRPRGQALGYVRHHPGEERFLYSKDDLERQIMICLGGAVAEEIFYHNRSTGSKNDFEQALSLVRQMIDCGLSDLGIVKIEMMTKTMLQKEIQCIFDRLLEKTKAILIPRQPVFYQSLDILFEEEVLNGTRFRELLKSC